MDENGKERQGGVFAGGDRVPRGDDCVVLNRVVDGQIALSETHHLLARRSPGAGIHLELNEK